MMRVVVLAGFALATRVALAQPADGSGAPQDPVPAQPDETEAARAKELYAKGEFKPAADAFHKAYELAPKSEHMFGEAQALRKAGDCTAALELYTKLLATSLDETDAAATRQAMALCEVKQPPAKQPPPPPPPEEHRIWYRDWKANVLAGFGVVAIGAGTWMTVQSFSDESAAIDAETYGEHQRLTNRATLLRVGGAASIGIGLIGASWAAYRYATVNRRVTLTAWRHPTGGGLAIGGAW